MIPQTKSGLLTMPAQEYKPALKLPRLGGSLYFISKICCVIQLTIFIIINKKNKKNSYEKHTRTHKQQNFHINLSVPQRVIKNKKGVKHTNPKKRRKCHVSTLGGVCQLVSVCADWRSMNCSNTVITFAFMEQHGTWKFQLLLVEDVISLMSGRKPLKLSMGY